ncbi:hypothetical protein AcetOrient_orf00716 [Acetobacter orientalis]|uniref:Uncharacterized protein n=1 Tax=Acetobacter orientalis TaxID=146474 RepID=A0A2Z5ZEM8_9PROT|nr:hypothetical protein AcetOrient_orf00716 [Acetobacter orientalis]
MQAQSKIPYRCAGPVQAGPFSVIVSITHPSPIMYGTLYVSR